VKDEMNYMNKTKNKTTIKLMSLECGFCEEVMRTSGDLKNHLSYVHFRNELGREFPEEKSTEKKNKNRCNLCGKSFTTDIIRIRHVGSFHDQALKYAKQFITVTDDDARLIPGNNFGEGLNESGEPFNENQLQIAQFLTDWEPLHVSKIPASGATKSSTPSVGTTTVEYREAGSYMC